IYRSAFLLFARFDQGILEAAGKILRHHWEINVSGNLYLCAGSGYPAIRKMHLEIFIGISRRRQFHLVSLRSNLCLYPNRSSGKIRFFIESKHNAHITREILGKTKIALKRYAFTIVGLVAD